MAARLKRLHQDDIRAKIRVAELIARLARNAMGELEPEMSTGQIQSARILLDKAISNAPTELSGIGGGPLEISATWLGGRALAKG